MGNYLPVSQRERELLSRIDGLIRERDEARKVALNARLKKKMATDYAVNLKKIKKK